MTKYPYKATEGRKGLFWFIVQSGYHILQLGRHGRRNIVTLVTLYPQSGKTDRQEVCLVYTIIRPVLSDLLPDANS